MPNGSKCVYTNYRCGDSSRHGLSRTCHELLGMCVYTNNGSMCVYIRLNAYIVTRAPHHKLLHLREHPKTALNEFVTSPNEFVTSPCSGNCTCEITRTWPQTFADVVQKSSTQIRTHSNEFVTSPSRTLKMLQRSRCVRCVSAMLAYARCWRQSIIASND